MSETRRVIIRIERIDGSVREYQADNPAGLVVEFTEDGGMKAHATGKPVTMRLRPLPELQELLEQLIFEERVRR